MFNIGDIDFEHLAALNNHDRYNYILTLDTNKDTKLAIARALFEAGAVTSFFVMCIELMIVPMS